MQQDSPPQRVIKIVLKIQNSEKLEAWLLSRTWPLSTQPNKQIMDLIRLDQAPTHPPPRVTFRLAQPAHPRQLTLQASSRDFLVDLVRRTRNLSFTFSLKSPSSLIHSNI